MLTVDPKRRATLSDVLRSRWMRSDGMESMATALPALSTATTTLRPVSVIATSTRPPNQQPQAKSSALPTYHPNDDISTTISAGAQVQQQYRNEPQNRHSYHPPGAHELKQQEYQQHQTQAQSPITINTQYVPLAPITTTTTHPVIDDQDDAMSDVSPANSPTETMATISPSTPAPSMDASGGIPYRDSPGKYRPSSGEEKHHPYKVHARTMSSSPDNITISMSPSSDTLVDGFDSSSKKKRKALTKLRQFFRFENKV